MDNIVYEGRLCRIEWAVTANGKMPAADFYNAQSETDRTRLMALFKLLGDNRKISNPQHFKKLEGTSLFEFKRFQSRIVCFFAGNSCVLLTNGFIKKSNKTPKKEIDIANQIMKEHLERLN